MQRDFDGARPGVGLLYVLSDKQQEILSATGKTPRERENRQTRKHQARLPSKRLIYTQNRLQIKDFFFPRF